MTSGTAVVVLQRQVTAIVNVAPRTALAVSISDYHVESKTARMPAPEIREIIADNLKKAGWSLGCVSALDCVGRTIWFADAYHGDGNRFIVRADEKLTAFLELEAAIRAG